MRTPQQRIVDHLTKHAVLRPRDLDTLGVSRYWLRALVERGTVVTKARGVYALADRDWSAHSTMVVAATRIPHGVVCLLSALRFHELTTQAPRQVWMAVDRKARRPSASDLPVVLMRFGGRAMYAGVEEHIVDGVAVKVYSVAKTVADCFKYRNKIGKDIALEALRECRAHGHASVAELWRMAEVCRVARVMAPYLEVLE